jgi:hypothetical protein
MKIVGKRGCVGADDGDEGTIPPMGMLAGRGAGRYE